MTLEVVALASRFALASLFLLAGLSKLVRRREFEAAVRRYEVLPPRFVPVVAALLPPFELLCGVLLAVGFGSVLAALLLAAVLVGFSVAVGINLLRGRAIDCGCFTSAAPRRITWLTVSRNLALAAMALTIAREAPAALSVDGLLFERADTALTDADALAIGAAVTAALAALALVRELPRIHRLAEVVAEAPAPGGS